VDRAGIAVELASCSGPTRFSNCTRQSFEIELAHTPFGNARGGASPAFSAGRIARYQNQTGAICATAHLDHEQLGERPVGDTVLEPLSTPGVAVRTAVVFTPLPPFPSDYMNSERGIAIRLVICEREVMAIVPSGTAAVEPRPLLRPSSAGRQSVGGASRFCAITAATVGIATASSSVTMHELSRVGTGAPASSTARAFAGLEPASFASASLSRGRVRASGARA